MRTTLAALCAASLAPMASAFVPMGSIQLIPASGRVHSATVGLRMAGNGGGGFGKAPINQGPQKSKLAGDRKDAAARYDALKESGAPEFNVYVRLKGGEDRDQEEGVIAGGWYPVGSMSCPSSQVINKAIFDSTDAILQGAFRANQKVISRSVITSEGKKVGKWQDLKDCEIEYGYLMKDFADEEIKVASPPNAATEMVGGFFSKISNAVNWVPDSK